MWRVILCRMTIRVAGLRVLSATMKSRYGPPRLMRMNADFLHFMSNSLFFYSALWHVYQPKSLADSKIIIKNISLIKRLEEYKGIQEGMSDGEDLRRGGSSMAFLSKVPSSPILLHYNRKRLSIYSDINKYLCWRIFWKVMLPQREANDSYIWGRGFKNARYIPLLLHVYLWYGG